MFDRAHSFAGVADAYDRGRPTYPREAAEWLTGSAPAAILELGAGTGKLTDQLLAIGHDVLATDPLDEMLSHLRLRQPGCRTVVASAESIPVASRSIDVVVCAQSFHWFDLEKALPEIARVLKPEGTLALVWNTRDDRIPWVKKLSRLLDSPRETSEPAEQLVASRLFGYVETQSFRFWHPLRKPQLRDLVVSVSHIAEGTDTERERTLRLVDSLYDDYASGPDGLLLPYVTECFKAVVRPIVLEDTGPIHLDAGASHASHGPAKETVKPVDPDDDGTPLFSLA